MRQRRALQGDLSTTLLVEIEALTSFSLPSLTRPARVPRTYSKAARLRV